MAISSSTNTGTLAVGLTLEMVRLKLESASNESKRTTSSSKGMPAWRSSTHGRMDQEE